jgi:hypothetical protein
MLYNNGADNVFIDLSVGGTNASANDSLGGTSATINVNYLTKGTSGSTFAASAPITVGAGTTYKNTAEGLIDAINNAGLGLSATFASAKQAGSAAINTATNANQLGGSGSDMGIMISGTGVGTGTNGAGEVGTLTAAGSDDLLGGSLTIVGADGSSHAIPLGTGNSTDTLANLAATINSANYGVTATYSATNHNVVFTSANSAVTVTGSGITDQISPLKSDTANLAITPNALAANTPGPLATITVGNPSDMLTSGQITILGNNNLDVGGGPITLGTPGLTDNLADLAAYINSQTAATPAIGLKALVNGTTLTISSTVNAGQAAIPTFTQGTLANAPAAMTPAVTVSTALTGTPTVKNAPYGGVVGSLTLGGSSTDTLSGTLNIGANTISLGTATGPTRPTPWPT